MRDNYINEIKRGEVERDEEWKKWCDKIPAIQFDSAWKVRVIPPFLGALARFWIEHNNKSVSVYFDGFSRLGWMVDSNDDPVPYYEMYDGDDCTRYYLDETDEMMADIRRVLNGKVGSR